MKWIFFNTESQISIDATKGRGLLNPSFTAQARDIYEYTDYYTISVKSLSDSVSSRKEIL